RPDAERVPARRVREQPHRRHRRLPRLREHRHRRQRHLRPGRGDPRPAPAARPEGDQAAQLPAGEGRRADRPRHHQEQAGGPRQLRGPPPARPLPGVPLDAAPDGAHPHLTGLAPRPPRARPSPGSRRLRGDGPMPPDALMSDGRPRTWTARIRCKDGDHTLELTHREVVAERLLRTSRKHSFDPDVDVDWDAPQDPDVFYMPPQLVAIYETPLWDRLTHRQRVELSKREMCSIASFGIWAELLLMQSLVMHAYRRRYDSDHVAYALTEIADECRHSKMFARMVRTCGLRTHRPRAAEFHLAKLLGAVYDPMPMFAGTLVVEEFTDAFQRLTFPDEDVQPMVRQVTRIHVIEEARHIKYAREELKR